MNLGAISDLMNTTASSSSDQSGSSATNRIANQDVFLKLLVAQVQNQNPMKPADGIEFITQLAQFTDLEQSMAMKKELESIHEILSTLAEGSTGPVETPFGTMIGTGQDGNN